MFTKEVRNTLKVAWPLLFAIALIMAANGLQGTLLSLRANAEGFPLYATGLIMSAYYLGFLAGCIVVPKLIASVGHIRVFAGFASFASTTILFHGLFVEPISWGIIRAVAGFSFVGLFVVAESWLNSVAPNKLRARIFSAYMLVVHGGLFSGQFMINLVSIEKIELFILVSVLISLSLIPITLADKPSPGFKEPETLPFRQLFSFSVLPIAGVFAAGMAGATIFAMGPIYAQESGFTPRAIAIFMGAYILGATTLPLGIGWLSDHFNRRMVILSITLASFVATLVLAAQDAFMNILIFIMGGMVASLYSVCIAFMHDRIKPSQVTSATGSLILINGMGACTGPFATGMLIDVFGKDAMFMMLAFIFLLTMTIGVYRTIMGAPVDVAKQVHFILFPARSSAWVMRLNEKIKKEKEKNQAAKAARKATKKTPAQAGQ